MSGPSFATLDPDSIEYGRVDQVSPTIRRVIAHNPSKYTYLGTGTYLVGRGDVVVVDPGPALDSHRDALAAALEGETVRAILVTHCHSDHSPLARWMSAETGAPMFAVGPHPHPDDDDVDEDDEDDEDDDLDDDAGADNGDPDTGDGEPARLEEPVDFEFDPDVRVGDGELAVEGAGMVITAVHTPGHTSNHACFAYESPDEPGGVLFTGDHVMGWSTTVVSPPDGDMADYVESLRKVAGRSERTLWPTHGPPRHDGGDYVAALVAHRLERERQVLQAVRSGLDSIPSIVALLYADVRRELHRPARRSVFAHLAKLHAEGQVVVDGGTRPRLRSRYLPT